MQENVGTTERIIRIAVGLAILPMLFFFDSHLRWLGLIGLIPLLTGIMKWCPGYFLLGVRLDQSRPR